MSDRRLPVRPDLRQLRVQAKELLRSLRAADADALRLVATHLPHPPAPSELKLADAQFVLARAHGVRSWPRLVLACTLIDAIWEDDLAALQRLVRKHPELLHEEANGTARSSWGPPLSYAANLGRDALMEMLHAMGARDLERALGRATLQGHVGTALRVHRWLGSPTPPAGSLGGPAYTLSVGGTELLLGLGAPVVDAAGRPLAPVDVVLETDARDPAAKHRILELYAEQGLPLPDTPTMALHRGRVDLLEAHVRRDPALLRRTFTHHEIYPPELGCHEDPHSTQGTPLAGTTLLHLCADYGESAIARWLLDRGADPDTRAAVDADGFGGHTALFCTVVSQPAFWANRRGAPDADMTRLLLDRGADTGVRASLRKQLHPGYGDHPVEIYRDVTALSWGRRFRHPDFVNREALTLIEESGGPE